GSGNDTLELTGDYDSPTGAFEIHASSLSSVEKIMLNEAGNDGYNLIFDDGVVGAGATMTVDASTLNATEFLSLDGSALTQGNLILKGGASGATLIGGAGNDVITGGSGQDNIAGGGGADILKGGGAGTGIDNFIYGPVSDSTGTNYDTIVNFDAAHAVVD